MDGQAGFSLLVDLIENIPEVHRPVLRGELANHLPG
jgi:hypothetical protein